MQAPTIHFPKSLRLRVPQGLPEALQTAAKQRHTTPSEWARQAILRGLEAQGVQLTTLEAVTEHQSECKGR